MARLLANELSLDEFEDWLVAKSWNSHLDSSESAVRLAYAIELRLAEHSSGHLDELDLRRELTKFRGSGNASWFNLVISSIVALISVLV